MTRALLFLIFVYTSQAAMSQSIPDSLRKKYDAAASSLEKGQILTNYFTTLQGNSPEQLKVLLPVLAYFTKENDETGVGYTHIFIGISYIKLDDPNEALKHGIAAFKIFDEVQDTFALLKIHTLIGNSYWFSGNLEESLNQWKKGLPAARLFDLHYYSRYLISIAGCFNDMKLPDSSMPYIQEALRIEYRLKDSLDISSVLATMGQTYMEMGQNELARTMFRQSISFIKATKTFYFTSAIAEGNDRQLIAQSFYNSGQYDSSLIYARQSLMFKSSDLSAYTGTAYNLMSKAFDKENKRDSANEYFRLATEIQNVSLSNEKSKNIQTQHFKEEVRQQEIAAQKAEGNLKHRQNIENALIALGVVTFTLLFLILSRSIITNERLIRFLGILALLLVFEFVNLLAHGYLDELTNHSQVMVLLLLVGIASLLIPLHHRLEKWATDKLVEKNKRIRLAAAKLTIEKLEGKVKSTDS
jgi:tetratricopeptide (TPR) repeat protein